MVVGLLYAVVAVSLVLSASVYQQARMGVSGPSVRRQRLERLAIALSYLGSFVALFVGPSAAWLAAGAGLFVALAAYTAASGRRTRG